MKEKPILFSGEMVKAILDGRKTQTRRTMKKPPEDSITDGATPFDQDGDCVWFKNGLPQIGVKGRFGLPGDRLWVKETFLNNALDGYEPVYFYRADDDEKPDDRHWKPSIFMPRVASRITLEIVNLRVERLHDISKDDVIAEGLYPNPKYAGGLYTWDGINGNSNNPKYAYQLLWESINGDSSWALNPWVWVIEFKRI